MPDWEANNISICYNAESVKISHSLRQRTRSPLSVPCWYLAGDSGPSIISRWCRQWLEMERLGKIHTILLPSTVTLKVRCQGPKETEIYEDQSLACPLTQHRTTTGPLESTLFETYLSPSMFNIVSITTASGNNTSIPLGGPAGKELIGPHGPLGPEGSSYVLAFPGLGYIKFDDVGGKGNALFDLHLYLQNV